MSRHISQDWRHRHLHFVLETRLMYEKSFRDAWLNWMCDAVSRAHEPLCSSRAIPYSTQQLFQRKVVTYQYNQHGLWKHPYTVIANVDRVFRHRGVVGTREWVPWVNLHHLTFYRMVRAGHIFAHRVHYRGYGTDKSLQHGGYSFRWTKTLVRNSMQYTRI